MTVFCGNNLQIVYKRDIFNNKIAGYVRDEGGMLFAFTHPSRYEGQEDRYKREVERVNNLALLLLDSLEKANNIEEVLNESSYFCQHNLNDRVNEQLPECIKLAMSNSGWNSLSIYELVLDELKKENKL